MPFLLSATLRASQFKQHAEAAQTFFA